MCGSNRCKTCNSIVVGDNFTSNLTGKKYKVVSPNDDMDCGTRNVIYLINCSRCGVQYIGKTCQTLRCRFNNHRSRLKQLCDLYLYNHFNSDGHNIQDMQIMPIEEVTLTNIDNCTLSSKLSAREEFWYKELGTIYPYGLNDNVRHIGNMSKMTGNNLIVYSLFNKQTTAVRKRPKKRSKNKIDDKHLRQHFMDILGVYKSPNFIHCIRTFLWTLPKRWMRQVWDIIEVFQLKDEITNRIAMMIRDMVTFRKGNNMHFSEVNKVNKDRMFMNVKFHNKGIDMLNLPGILHNREVLKAVPTFLKYNLPPIVSYSYTKTISRNIFNFKDAIKNIDFVIGTGDLICNCCTSPFVYPPVGHVITGNLNIVKNGALRRLLMKGPSFREQNNINWDVNVHLCKEAINKYKEKWARKECIDKSVLHEWEQTVYKILDKRIGYLKRKHINKRKMQVLRNKKHLDYLRSLHDKYVLVPADKASNNVVVICKKYYMEVMINEMTNSGLKTYEEVSTDLNIINKHIEDMKSYNIELSDEVCQLPHMYWLPKMHKDPFGSRFIAASNKCTTKPISALITSCLNKVLQHFQEYCEGIFRNTGINPFWVINNSQQVLNKVNSLNQQLNAQHFDSFDFTTLYTSIPHDSLKCNLKLLIDEAFKVRGAGYLSINYKREAYWTQSKLSKRSIDQNNLVSMIEYLVDNIYIVVGNRVYRQCIGIPMGTDCAPLLANLYLFSYEYRYIRNLMKHNFQIAKKFNNTVRYIDDLLTMNNPYFIKAIQYIYPKELVLKKTTEKPDMVSYLDICISIMNKRFCTSVYDKRDSFNFHIVNFPFLNSNIPVTPAYGIYISQLVRVGRICSDYENFVLRHRYITTRLVKQGFRYNKLCKMFVKFSHKYESLFKKFGASVRQHVRDGICLPLCVDGSALTRNITYRCT